MHRIMSRWVALPTKKTIFADRLYDETQKRWSKYFNGNNLDVLITFSFWRLSCYYYLSSDNEIYAEIYTPDELNWVGSFTVNCQRFCWFTSHWYCAHELSSSFTQYVSIPIQILYFLVLVLLPTLCNELRRTPDIVFFFRFFTNCK